MRTKTLSVNGQKIKAVLICGGPGFKVYSHGDSWILVQGKTKRVFKNNDSEQFDPEYSAISYYVNLRYYSLGHQWKIIEEFHKLLNKETL